MGSGYSLVCAIENFGTITNNPQLYDIIPRIIRNRDSDDEKEKNPSFPEVLLSNVDLVMIGLSIFIMLRILIPKSIVLGGFTFWFFIGSFILVPSILSIVLSIIRMYIPNGKGEESVIMPGISLGFVFPSLLFLLYIAWPLTAITGFGIGGIYILLWLFVFVPLVMGIVVLSKFIAPFLILLLGPGVIPQLMNQSFFEFCS